MTSYETLSGTTPNSDEHHQPRVMRSHRPAKNEDPELRQMMSEIEDGVFVAWTDCASCRKNLNSCGCINGPVEPKYIGPWRDRRFVTSFDRRGAQPALPELQSHQDRRVAAVLRLLRSQGWTFESPASLAAAPPAVTTEEIEQWHEADDEGTDRSHELRPATEAETEEYLAGHTSIEGAEETEHGLQVPDVEPERIVQVQPDHDAAVEVWRTYGVQEGVAGAEKMNRSQIRTALGIPHAPLAGDQPNETDNIPIGATEEDVPEPVETPVSDEPLPDSCADCGGELVKRGEYWVTADADPICPQTNDFHEVATENEAVITEPEPTPAPQPEPVQPATLRTEEFDAGF